MQGTAIIIDTATLSEVNCSVETDFVARKFKISTVAGDVPTGLGFGSPGVTEKQYYGPTIPKQETETYGADSERVEDPVNLILWSWLHPLRREMPLSMSSRHPSSCPRLRLP